VYVLRPPASAAAVLRGELLVQGKWAAAKGMIGASFKAPFPLRAEAGEESSALDSVPAKTERLRAILESWRWPPRAAESADACVASVCAPRSGFIAAVSVEERSLLLASTSGCVSAELDSQIAACLLCEGAELNTDPDDYEAAIAQIHAWLEHDLASSSAGVTGSHSRVRTRLLHRIDAAIQNAPPHVRAAISQVAARARSIATSQHGAALESELESLAHSLLPDHEWLEAVVGLENGRQSRQRVAKPTATVAIHALLLFRASA
jgi:hypothetical protein